MKMLSRKKFLKLSTSVGAGTLLGSALMDGLGSLNNALAIGDIQGVNYDLNKPENIINSVCLQCNIAAASWIEVFEGICGHIVHGL